MVNLSIYLYVDTIWILSILYIRRPCRCYSKAGRRLGPPKVSSSDLSFHLCSQVQTDHQPVRPPKLSLLRGPGLPFQPLKTIQRPRRAFHGQLATVGQSLETAAPLQGQVQAALAVKAVIFQGIQDCPANAFKASQGFSWAACDRRSKLGDSCATPVQGQVQAALAVTAVIFQGIQDCPANASKASQGFSWAACDRRSKLGDSCATPGASTGSFGRQSCHF